MDDGSTDDTVESARAAAAELEHVRVVRLEHNSGKGWRWCGERRCTPTAAAFAPDGRIFVAEQSGRVMVAFPGNPNPRMLVDLSSRVNSYFERGLNGIAVDSAFARNHYLYLSYTHGPGPDDGGPSPPG